MNKIVIQKSQYNDLDNAINISEQNVNNDVNNTIKNPVCDDKNKRRSTII
jgi:hypothetical protein